MAYYLIVRGPLGVGKSTVAQEIALAVHAEYVSIDRLLDEHELWVEGLLPEFLAANVIAAKLGARRLSTGQNVVFDGNFYWREQLEDLEARLPWPHSVFTLDAPLAVCIERDGARRPPHGAEAARQVFAKCTSFQYGSIVDANRPLPEIVADLLSHLPPADRPPSAP